METRWKRTKHRCAPLLPIPVTPDPNDRVEALGRVWNGNSLVPALAPLGPSLRLAGAELDRERAPTKPDLRVRKSKRGHPGIECRSRLGGLPTPFPLR